MWGRRASTGRVAGRVPLARLCDNVGDVTTRRATVLIAGLLVSSLFAGCGGEDPPDPLATRGGFCVEWAKRACNDEVVDACAATDAEACQEAQVDHCESLVSASAYNRSLARGCLDAVRTALAKGELDADGAALVLRGEEACSFSCIEGEDGTCIEPTVVAGGEECSDADTICDAGFYCDGDHCIAKRGAGRDCGADQPCRDDLNCVGEVGAQVCEERAANGAACTDDIDCQSGICAQGAQICASRIILSAAEPACELFR